MYQQADLSVYSSPLDSCPCAPLFLPEQKRTTSSKVYITLGVEPERIQWYNVMQRLRVTHKAAPPLSTKQIRSLIQACPARLISTRDWGFRITGITCTIKCKPWNLACIKVELKFLACEQALCGTLAAGWEKEGGCATTSLEFEYLHKKVDEKCWLTEMTLVMMSLPLARVFQCLFTFALVSTSRWLAEIWQLSQRETTEELEVEFEFHLQFLVVARDVVASSPSFSRPTARAPTRAFLRAYFLSLQASSLGGYGGPKMMSFLFLSTYQDVKK